MIENLKTDVYTCTASELLGLFEKAAVHATLLKAGLVKVDTPLDEGVEEFDYLRGAVLARLEGLAPPAMPGDRVQRRPGKEEPVSVNKQQHALSRGKRVKNHFYHTGRCSVASVWYAGRGRWFYEIGNHPGHGYRYPAKFFEKITS